jgi:hypothetical protein
VGLDVFALVVVDGAGSSFLTLLAFYLVAAVVSTSEESSVHVEATTHCFILPEVFLNPTTCADQPE